MTIRRLFDLAVVPAHSLLRAFGDGRGFGHQVVARDGVRALFETEAAP